MKKIFVIAVLGLAGLGLDVGRASAGLLNCFCCKKCTMKLSAKQYNAFSPYCLDSVSGCVPATSCCGFGHGGVAFCPCGPDAGYGGCGPACSHSNGGWAMGELPAPGPGQAFNGPMVMPGEALQGWPNGVPGMVNPNALPGNYPVIMGNGPVQTVPQ